MEFMEPIKRGSRRINRVFSVHIKGGPGDLSKPVIQRTAKAPAGDRLGRPPFLSFPKVSTLRVSKKAAVRGSRPTLRNSVITAAGPTLRSRVKSRVGDPSGSGKRQVETTPGCPA